MNWDDIRVIRAVYSELSFAAAARRLGVNPTTVPRRLERLEKTLGFRLFDAADGARRPTAECEQLVELSEPIARQMEKIESLQHAESEPRERRRIAATDSVSAAILAPALPAFLDEHPRIDVDLMASTENVDFSRWEADVAIRLKRPESGNFIVSRLADFEFFLCEPAVDDASAPPLICTYPEELMGAPEAKALADRTAVQAARCTSKNLLVLKALVLSGRAAAALPGFLLHDLPAGNTIRLTPLPARRSAWLLVQTHLRNDATTRLLTDWIKDLFRPGD